jgi:hypothetical protein
MAHRENIDSHLSLSELTQCDDSGLVPGRLHHWRAANRELPCPDGCHQCHIEAIGNFFQAIINRNARHNLPRYKYLNVLYRIKHPEKTKILLSPACKVQPILTRRLRDGHLTELSH